MVVVATDVGEKASEPEEAVAVVVKYLINISKRYL